MYSSQLFLQGSQQREGRKADLVSTKADSRSFPINSGNKREKFMRIDNVESQKGRV
jgi:hypothetical protein